MPTVTRVSAVERSQLPSEAFAIAAKKAETDVTHVRSLLKFTTFSTAQ
jgi:hypothetical protein